MYTDIGKLVDVLGKPVVDPYGRRLGYVVSIYSNADGKVTSLEVNYNDVEYKEIPIERFNITAEAVVLIPDHEYKALIVENRLKIIKSRLASLEDLYAKKEVPTHAYEAFKKKLESEIVSVKAMSKEVKDSLRKRIHEVEDQIAEVEKAMAALKTSYLAGEIPEKPYLLAVDIMKKSLEILLKEKESLKKHLDLIESLEVIPLSPAVGLATQESKGQSEDQPMQVVVVE
ncbi:MAG: CdvA-like protein [Desulfurococcaceae archaeon]